MKKKSKREPKGETRRRKIRGPGREGGKKKRRGGIGHHIDSRRVWKLGKKLLDDWSKGKDLIRRTYDSNSTVLRVSKIRHFFNIELTVR